MEVGVCLQCGAHLATDKLQVHAEWHQTILTIEYAADREMPELMNADELEAMELSATLANLLRKICGQEDRKFRKEHPELAEATIESQKDHDWAELAQYVHMIQTKVMSQAAARAYPGKFRLIGEVRPPVVPNMQFRGG